MTVHCEARFNQMVTASRDAIEDFNDFADDRAIVWAGQTIKELTAERDAIKESAAATICSYSEEVVALKAEVKKYRAALEEIKDGPWGETQHRNIAREALEGVGDEIQTTYNYASAVLYIVDVYRLVDGHLPARRISLCSILLESAWGISTVWIWNLCYQNFGRRR